ncbi:hypothetical protein [Lacimonas salitolerans]|uniref:PH domain-containing protein n=1 Tax=Lacimonas salitolerans TaxID=1323750 RepID=A0ABW4ECV9_9RHOB
MENDEILARVQVSQGRRLMGVAMLVGLGAMLLYLSVVQPPAGLGWRVFLVVFGVLAVFLGVRMHTATALDLELTADVLRDSSGTVLARVDQIEGIDRGIFAFKPSNGFLLRLSARQPRRWAPGLWWRMGRRVGVGGVTPRHQTKFMAEVIQAHIGDRT